MTEPTELDLVTQERDELRATFNLRWDADMRAIKLWQAAHPERGDVWPDHADMVVWLMEQLVDLDWFCAYCGWTTPRSEPVTVLQEHVKACEKHPLAEALDTLRRLSNFVVDVGSPEIIDAFVFTENNRARENADDKRD